MSSTAFNKLQQFILQLKKLGVENAVVSPGSRNAPVIKALEQLNVEMHSVVDERSAGFVALGMAKSSKKPVVLSCTSGTAMLNYYPAIAEAFYSRVPLIILAADRPAEQIDQWEGQSIRQTNAFSNHVRLQSTLNLYGHEESIDCNELIKEIPGPIFINIPLHEPLYTFDEPIPSNIDVLADDLKSYGISKTAIAQYLGDNWENKKILFFQGMEAAEDITFVPEGEPLLCDVTSSKKGNIQFWDAMLFLGMKQVERFEVLKPDILITSGNTTVSKGLRHFLKSNPPQKHFHISAFKEVGNMFNTHIEVIHLDSLQSNEPKIIAESTSYFNTWNDLNAQFALKFDTLNWQDYNQFSACRHILNRIENGAVLHFANSMPIRYASLLAMQNVHCNRGTSGIDGCTSTAVGYAMQHKGSCVLITGDVAFLYDINALWNQNLPKGFKIIVLNNQGGGIFEMIDGPQKMGDTIRFQTTPHQRSIKSLAAHFGISYFCANDMMTLLAYLETFVHSSETSILEIKTGGEADQHFYKTFKDIAI